MGLGTVPETGIGPQLTVHIRDISPGGMRILSRNMLHVGYVGAVRLVRADKSVIIMGIRVVRCHYEGDMLHDCGMEFLEQPPSGCVSALRAQT